MTTAVDTILAAPADEPPEPPEFRLNNATGLGAASLPAVIMIADKIGALAPPEVAEVNAESQSAKTSPLMKPALVYNGAAIPVVVLDEEANVDAGVSGSVGKMVSPKPIHKNILAVLDTLGSKRSMDSLTQPGSSNATTEGSQMDGVDMQDGRSDAATWGGGDAHDSASSIPAKGTNSGWASETEKSMLAVPPSSTAAKHRHHAPSEKRSGPFEPLRRFVKDAFHAKEDKKHGMAAMLDQDMATATRSADDPPTPPASRPTSTAPSERSLRDRCGRSVRMIGVGTGGTVRLFKLHAEDGQVKTFAVKEFRKRGSREDERAYIKRLTAEYCIASTLRHENVIETLDMVFEPPHVYCIMEYCPRDLYTLLTIGNAPTPELATLFCYFGQLSRGLEYLHACGISHLDIKLENCVVSASGILKIIDFGSAEVVRGPWESRVHRVRGFRGSDPYVGPEVWQGGEYDGRREDCWSAGIILVCMVARHFPWASARVNEKEFARWVRICQDAAVAEEHGVDCDAPASMPETSTLQADGAASPMTTVSSATTATTHDPMTPHETRNCLGEEKATSPSTVTASSSQEYLGTVHSLSNNNHSTQDVINAEQFSRDLQARANLRDILDHWLVPGQDTRCCRVVHGLLEVDPLRRWTMQRVVDSEWLQSQDICTTAARSHGHTHQGIVDA